MGCYWYYEFGIFYLLFVIMTKNLFYTALWLMGLMGTLAIWVVNAQSEPSKDIVLEATATETGNTLTINKYFANAYTVDWWDGSPIETVSWHKTHTYSAASGYTITLSTTADRWTFGRVIRPLVPKDGTTMTWVKITYMPPLADWFWDNTVNPWNNFFSHFNYSWALTSLPTWSFDTSNITEVGIYFFSDFNKEWALTNLPIDSFDISNITEIGDYFLMNFNFNWALTNLPKNSFRFSTWLNTVGRSFFESFNYKWALTSLPDNSFNTDNIMTEWSSFFVNFNEEWALTNLPKNSFRFSTWLNTVGNSFFYSFNQNWKLTSLPTWSFDTSNIKEVWNGFFASFNYQWELTGLPDWSFDVSKITSIGTYFFHRFNYGWKITYLPDSFTIKMLPEWSWLDYVYTQAFYSSSYTLNRKVSDLVSWQTAPSSDRDTFSNNQPWRCGVAANWLYSPYGACKVVYNPNGWLRWGNSSNWTWSYYSYDTGVLVPNEGLTRIGYLFTWWYTSSTWWTKITMITFPDIDGNTLYAGWYACFARDGSTITNYNTWCGLNVRIPSIIDGVSITSIWANAFNSKWITGVIIPDSVTSIWISAFENNDLTEVTIPDSVMTIWNNAFCNNSINPIIWYKASWTINNANNACITEPYINFHANEWKFDNNSDTKKVLATKTASTITKHSSSPNRSYNTSTNSWVKNGVYDNDLDEYQTITITWAATLEINIHYATEWSTDLISLLDENWNIITEDLYWWEIWNNGWISWDDGDCEYEEICDENDCDEIYYNCSMFDEIYIIPWDTVTFYFNSDVSVRYDWYYADIRPWLSYTNPNADTPTQTGYLWTWWYTNTGLSTPYVVWSPWSMDSTDAYVKWEPIEYTITFVDWSWIESEVIYTWLYESAVNTQYPSWTKDWYTISWDKAIPTTMPLNWDTITASWTENEKPSWGSSGWWGSSNKTDTDTQKEGKTPIDSSAEPQNDNTASSWANAKDPLSVTPIDSSAEASEWQQFTEEFQQSYEFAHKKWITTMPSIQKADMNWKLTRIAMAKMLSQYAINVLWQKPANIVVPKFNDVTNKMDSDYDNGVTLAYQLWIMWQNMPNNKFRPNDEVTRAEFATALSRMLYKTSDWEYKSTPKYYIHHMEKLVKEWIITKSDPAMKELRGYVMIMLMRSAK